MVEDGKCASCPVTGYPRGNKNNSQNRLIVWNMPVKSHGRLQYVCVCVCVWWISMKKFVPQFLTSEQQQEQIFDAENIAVVLTHLIWSLVIYSCFQE